MSKQLESRLVGPVRKSFVMYCDQYDYISKLEQEQKGDLLDAIFAYQNQEAIRELDRCVEIVFAVLKSTFDRDYEKYLQKVERNRRNGAKGGRPKKPTGFSGLQEKPQKPDSDSDTVNDNDSGSGSGSDIIISNNDSKVDFKKICDFWNSFSSKKDNFDYPIVEEQFERITSLSDGYSFDQIMQAAENFKRAFTLETSQAKDCNLYTFLNGKFKKFLPGVFDIDHFDRSNFESCNNSNSQQSKLCIVCRSEGSKYQYDTNGQLVYLCQTCLEALAKMEIKDWGKRSKDQLEALVFDGKAKKG